MTKSPCKRDCPNRSIEPNCHNEDVCELWAAYMAEKRIDDERISKAKEYERSKAAQFVESARRNRRFRFKRK